MEPFTGVDFYAIDDLLSQEERMVRDTVREFVDRRVMPDHRRLRARGPLPLGAGAASWRAWASSGAPLQGYDCAGLGAVAYGLALQELERGDSALRSFVSVQTSLAMYAIHAFGSEAQKGRWLPAMARGEKIGCFGLTEPDFGSNPAGLATRAAQDAGRLRPPRRTRCGSPTAPSPTWPSCGPSLEDRINGFLVEKGTPGFSTTLQKGKWSLRASVTSELHLQDCRVPD